MKVHDLLGLGIQPNGATTESAEEPHPAPRGGGGGGMGEAIRRPAVEVAHMPGVKLHRREMVRKMVVGMAKAMMHLEGGDEGLRVLTSVLTKVRDGGHLDEEDDGYYCSSEEEGEDAAKMAERGVGEARRMVVTGGVSDAVRARCMHGAGTGVVP